MIEVKDIEGKVVYLQPSEISALSEEGDQSTLVLFGGGWITLPGNIHEVAKLLKLID